MRQLKMQFLLTIFSKPMSGVKVATTPYSEFEFPGIIMHKDIISIPITLYWNVEKAITRLCQ